jgi:hypothetical protein
MDLEKEQNGCVIKYKEVTNDSTNNIFNSVSYFYQRY